MPDGKHLIATGTETGKSARTYLIDVQTGDAKPLTPEGYSGTIFSRDGSKVAMRGPDGTWGVWTMADSKFTPIPSLDPKYGAIDWTRDDRELYVISNELKEHRQRVYRLPENGQDGILEGVRREHDWDSGCWAAASCARCGCVCLFLYAAAVGRICGEEFAVSCGPADHANQFVLIEQKANSRQDALRSSGQAGATNSKCYNSEP